MSSKKKEIKLEELSPEEKMKYEIAAEMGLLDEVMQNGWNSLSAKDTGRIGGVLSNRRRKLKSEQESEGTAS